MNKTCSRRLPIAVMVAALLLPGPALARSAGAPSVADPSVVPTETAEEICALNIMSQTAWTYRAGPAGTLEEGHRSAYIGYDRNGNALEQTSYNEDGSILQRIVNVCDDEGFLIESAGEGQTGEGDARTVFDYEGDTIVATTSFRPDGSVLVATSYTYDADGQVLSALTEVPDVGIAQTIVFEYDTEGSAVRTVSYDTDGRVLVSAETSHDEEGHPLESIAFLPDGSKGSSTSFAYDTEGRATSVVVTNGAGVVTQSVTNVYGAGGRVVETTTGNPAAGIEHRVTVEYDEQGMRMLERTYNKLGELVSETRYVYELYEEQDDDEEQENARD